MQQLKILVPTNFSAAGNNAFQFACGLGRSLKARVDLIHIYHFRPSEFNEYTSVSEEGTMQSETRHIEQQFQQLLDSADPAMTGPPRAIESGFTARQIIEYAATNNYDYIVMGAKGTSNRIAELYGSNTIQVASQSPCPLIVVPPTARFRPIASIAFATAYDKKERQVHAGLQQLAATLGASIHYVNVNTKTTSHKAESSVLIENHPHADADLWIINDPSIKNGLETFIGQKKIDLLVVFKTPKNLWQWLTQSGTTRKMMLNPTIPLVVLSGASRFGK